MAHNLLRLLASGGTQGSRAHGLCSCGMWTPECVGSVVCSMPALYLRHVGSVVVAFGLSCPAACGILVPQSGIKPASSALEGRFFTTGPPGKSQMTSS